MIKDRAIKRTIKGKVMAMVMTAFMASFFVPLGVAAADADATGGGGTATEGTTDTSGGTTGDTSGGTTGDTRGGTTGGGQTDIKLYHDLSTEDVVISGTENCYVGGKCKGHIITGKGSSTTNTIKVQGGTHDITIEDVNIDVSKESESKTAFELTDNKTRVNLTLKGTNILKSGKNCAGLYVPASATLEITEGSNNATLDATGGMAGAGIGGAGAPPDAGTITINAGTITARGGDEAAGIGSFQSGTVKAITINGGNIMAQGGPYGGVSPGGKGAAGIGYGIATGGVSDFKIEINGGNVKAFGGTGKDSTLADGISCDYISSTTGNDGLITTNKLKTTSLNGLKDFQGLIWTGVDGPNDSVVGKTCMVYGDAALPDGFELPKDSTLEIPAGASLTLPADTKWDFMGTITGKGTIINADSLSPGSMAGWAGLTQIKLTVTLNEDDFIPTSCMFTGENLIDEAVKYNGTREVTKGKKYEVIVPESWERRIKNENNEPSIDKDGKAVMIDAGKYTVEYVNTKSNDKVMVSKEITIKKRPLTDCKISEIESPMFTGKTITPEVTIVYEPTSYPLTEGNDFDIEYEMSAPANRVNAGTYQMTIYGIKNFTDTKEEGGRIETEYTIRKASLEELNTTITLPADREYDGSPFTPKPEAVTVEGVYADKENPGRLDPAEDYEVTYSTDDHTSAGEITVTVTGKGKNFEHSATAVYTINKRPLTVTSVTAEDRVYDGTTNVKVVDIKVDMTGAVKGDEADIEVNPEAVIGLISQPDVGEYYDIKFGDAPLAGKKGKNYCLDVKKSYSLTKVVKITQREAPVIKLNVAKYEVGADPEKPDTFICYITATGATANDIIDPKGKIMFCMDAENPTSENTAIWKVGESVSLGLDPENPDQMTLVGKFDGIAPGSTHTFYAYTEGTRNVKESSVGSCTADFEKLPQDPPEKCELTISDEANADGETFTATVIPYEEGRYEYSFDGGATYGSSNVYEGCLPGTKYVAYIRYAETATHRASEGTPSGEVTTKKLKANTPVIEVAAGGTTFRGRTNVVINYPSAVGMSGVSIYYTTNGSEPNENSTLYTGQFQITDTTTVKAIAVSDMLEKSETAAVTLEKTGDTEIQSVADLKVGLTDNMIEPLLGKRLDEDTVVDSAETVQTFMTALLSAIPGYVNQNVKVYDLTIRIAIYDDKGKIIDWVTPTEQDFPIKVSLSYDQLQLPEGVSGTTHDFVVTHMFAAEMRNHLPGETEEPTVEKTEKGISFYVDGMSPLAVAWKEVGSNDPGDDPADPTDPNNPDNPTDPTDPNNQDNPTDPTDPDNPDNPTDPTDPDNPTNTDDPNQNPNGEENPNGDGATTTTDPTTQGVSDESRSALSSIMPKTGDPISFIPWIAAAVVSIGVIVGLVKKKSGKKKKPNKSTKNTTQKTQKTKKKKK